MSSREIFIATQNLEQRVVNAYEARGNSEQVEFANRLRDMLPMLEMACDGTGIWAPSKYMIYKDIARSPRDFVEMAVGVDNNVTDYRIHSWLANVRNYYANGNLVGNLDYPLNLRIINQHIGDMQGDPEGTLHVLSGLYSASKMMLQQVLENWTNIGAHASIMRMAGDFRRKIEKFPIERLMLRLESVQGGRYRDAISGTGGSFPLITLGFTWLLGGGVEMEGFNHRGNGKYVMSEEPVSQRMMEQLGWQKLPTLLRDAEAEANR